MGSRSDDTGAADRILPETLWAAWIIVAILVPSFLILWVFPGRTEALWAWHITSPMTSVFMGAGYGAGAFFFANVGRGGRWTPVSAGVLGAAVFALLMLVVTLIHWTEFNRGRGEPMAILSFYAWVVVYVVSPFAVFALWWRNRAVAGAAVPENDDVLLSAAFRRGGLAVGAATIALGAFLLLAPTTALDNWPWPLTPLTARVIGCFTSQVGLGVLVMSRDPRWAAWRLLAQTFMLATFFQIAGAARVWSSFRSDAHALLFVTLLVTSGAGAAYLYLHMSRRERSVPVGSL